MEHYRYRIKLLSTQTLYSRKKKLKAHKNKSKKLTNDDYLNKLSN